MSHINTNTNINSNTEKDASYKFILYLTTISFVVTYIRTEVSNRNNFKDPR